MGNILNIMFRVNPVAEAIIMKEKKIAFGCFIMKTVLKKQ